MASKKVLFGCLVAAVFLCLVQAVFLIKLKYPETRFIIRTTNQTPSVEPETPPEPNQNQPFNAEPPAADPEWRTQHYNLYFLESDDDVKVIETGVKNQLFALRSPGPSGFGSYNLWFVPANGRAKFLSGEAMTECDSVDIGKADDYVYADYRTSPCEAGSSHTVSYYRPDGNLAFTLFYGTGYASGSGKMTFPSGTKTQTLEIAPVWNGSCKVPPEHTEDESSAPPIEFTGVTASLDGGKKTFYAIDKKRTFFCEMQYGGGFDFPGITDASLSDGKVKFSTSFGVSITIDLDKANTPPAFDVIKTVWPSDKPDALFLPPDLASEVAFSQVPILLLKDKDVGYMKLFTHRNGSAEFDGQRGHYYIRLYQRLDLSPSQPGNTDIKVRGSDVTITGADLEYDAKWKENNTAYDLNVYCFDDDHSTCRTKDELNNMLKTIVYVGGNNQ